MFIMDNYSDIKLIYQSKLSNIFSGIRTTDNTPVIIKTLHNETPSFSEISALQFEYDIGREFNHKNIIKMLNFQQHGSKSAIIMEYFHGDPLSKILKSREIGLSEFFDIAIQLVEATGEIHSKNVIHKDINPSNILWDEKEKTLKLIDFGISSKLPRELQTVVEPQFLEGTLLYMSPEQTGRMNRSIDYRSDYYSVGMTLYEILTGTPCFECDDILEIIHCHIARIPVPPAQRNKNIPLSLSDIIMKLLAKNAEERYQSSFGIIHDLKQCQKSLLNNSPLDNFFIGEKDIPERFELPEKLYGREKEIDILLKGFDEVVENGTSKILMISGESGIGKSVLVHEIYKSLLNKRGYFITGKAEQFGRNTPFMPIIQAIQELITKILGESDEQMAKWKERMLASLGNNGQVLVDVVPQLETIIGKQPPIPELDPAKNQNRFLMVFQSFVKALATKEQPLVIFIDDLQWTDTQTLKMIELITTDIQYIYFIGSYRENEVSPLHPLFMTLQKISESKTEIETISLLPLTQKDIRELICDAIKCAPIEAEELSRICFQKTQGNPFFVNHFLKSLYQESLIFFDLSKGSWVWDVEKLNEKSITDNVVELMSKKIKKLPSDTQEILQLAASIGNKFDLYTLSIVSEHSMKETSLILWAALKENLIIPIDRSYKFITSDTDNFNAGYKFLHDKVQYAAYSQIDEETKKSVHLKIGQLILDNTPPDKIDGRIFDITHHLNIGAECIVNQEDKKKLAHFNLLAGKKAQNSTSYAIAFEYNKKGIQMLDDNVWTDDYYTLSHALYSAAAESAYLCGNYNDMEYYTRIALSQSKNLIDKLKIYEIMMRSMLTQNREADATNLGVDVLRLCKIRIRKNPGKLDILLALIKTNMLLHGKTQDQLVNQFLMKDELMLAVTRILWLTGFAAYLSNNLMLFSILGMMGVEFCLTHGNNYLAPIAYVALSVLMRSLYRFDEAEKWANLYIALTEKLYLPETQGMHLMLIGTVCQQHREKIKDTVATFEESYLKAIECGDFEYANFALYNKARNAYFCGMNLEKVYEIAQQSQEKMNSEFTKKINLLTLQSVSNLIEHKDNPGSLSGPLLIEEEFVNCCIATNNTTTFFTFYLDKAVLAYLFHDYEEAYICASKIHSSTDGVAGMAHVPIYLFYECLIDLAIYPGSTIMRKRALMRTVKSNLKKLRIHAKYAPMNYQHKVCLIEAELAKVQNEHKKAIQCYEQAIALAAENEFINDEGLANELASRYFLSISAQEIAGRYLNSAICCYGIWGAKSKVRHLVDTYPELSGIVANSQVAATHTHLEATVSKFTTTHLTSIKGSNNIDFISVIKSLQALSQEMDYNSLTDKLIKVITENAGAQKIILLCKESEEYLIEVEHDILDDSIKMDSNEEPIRKYPEALIHYVVRTGKTIVIPDALKSMYAGDKYISLFRPRSILCMPLMHTGEAKRILYLENNTAYGAFTPDRMEILSLLSSQMSISIENAKLYQRAISDGLTGIYNRAFFDNYISKAEAQAKCYKRSLSLLMVDIDHFKLFNDTYGHQIGDQVLKKVAKSIQNTVRSNDIVSRYGGEEFTVIMPETSYEGALVVAEKIRKAIEELTIPYNDGHNQLDLKVTVSIGAAMFSQDDDRFSLISNADRNLYIAKNNGRNRVVGDKQ